MLSTLAVISIFAEIFAAGVLLSGAFTFFKKFFRERSLKDLFLSFVFLSYFIYVFLMLASQILYNLEKPIAVLIILQKIITVDLIIGSFLVLVFTGIRFKIKFFSIIASLYALFLSFLVYQALAAPVALVYRFDVIEPLINFSMPIPIWGISWGLLFIVSFINYVKQKGAAKSLLFYGCLSSLFISSAYFFSTTFYLATQNSYFLLIAWLLTLVGSIFLLLSEVIHAESPLAGNPINFLRSRILFKLIIIFVLLIVILFELTTLATLSLSRQALKNSILSKYMETAQSLLVRINDIDQFDKKKLQSFVEEKSAGKSLVVLVVDKNGKLLAHPDKTKASLGFSLKAYEPVRKALLMQSGSGQFPPDEFGQISVGAYLPIKKFGGAIIVEEPLDSAFFQLRQLETNSLLFIIAGIILTVFTGLFLAQSIESPVHKLTMGTEAVTSGNLSQKIEVDSIDELGTLAHAFNKMTQELKDSQERLILSEKLASLGTMAAGMAHEIKNPLVSLRTFSQLLQQKWEDKEFREKFNQIVPTEIERINKIAESLLKFGRPMKSEMSKVNINSILEEILLLFESECKKNNVKVSSKFAVIPEIVGDSQQLSQAFVNILLNAIQAMEKGGELIVKTDVGEMVYLGSSEKDLVKKDASKQTPIKSVFIEITDTGPGIAPENLKSLFDPFFTTKAKGTGMGLPITLRIIEEHKGSIKVKSEVGKGTTFLITLPMSS